MGPNMGYQPLARQALTRFVTCEMKRIARERISELRGSKPVAPHKDDEPVPDPEQHRRAA